MTKNKNIPKNYKVKKLTNKKKQLNVKRFRIYLFIFVFACIGVVLLKSFAATTVGALQTETMTMSSGMSQVINDSSAGGGKALLLTTGTTATGTLNLTAKATNVVLRARGVQCKGAPQAVVSIDGSQALMASVSSTSWTDYNAAKELAAGSHSVSITFANPGGTGKKCSRSLTVDVLSAIDSTPPTPVADTTAPATSVTSPGNATTVSGVVAVKATASDNVAVTKVEFYVDSKLSASVTASPYGFSWDTAGVANGSHSLTTKAYDAAGNVGSPSNAMTVNVNNTAPSPVVSSPSGVAMPVGDVTSGGHVWKQVRTEDFTKDAALGSWGSDCDAGKTLYTGATGTPWRAYPKCYLDTYQKRPYRSDQVLSVHDGSLDFWLHTVDGKPAGANPSPVMPNGTLYQTYGRYEARFKLTSSNLSHYYTAWLLWPQDGSKWTCAESDFPESHLSGATVTAFAHYSADASCPDATRTQDAFSKTVDQTQWHTYTQECKPGKRNYYIDGVLIGSSTKYVYAGPERWQLQTETNSTCESTNSCTQDGHLLLDWAVVYSY